MMLGDPMRWKLLVLAAASISAFALLLYLLRPPRQDRTVQTALSSVVDDYRKIIVLMDGADSLDEAAHARCNLAGQALFWRKQHALDQIAATFAEPSARTSHVRQLIRYLTEDRSLHDADKLAFLDLVSRLAEGGTPDLRPLLDNLQSTQLAYRDRGTLQRPARRLRRQGSLRLRVSPKSVRFTFDDGPAPNTPNRSSRSCANMA
jgi:hypothetical protein